MAAGPALDCNGEADVVLAIPASRTQVPQSEFDLYEDFLIDMVNYYTVKKDRTNVGLIIYGSEPMVMNGLMPSLNKRDIFTRISLMAQRELYHFMAEGSNVVKAMDSIIKLHTDSKRKVPKIGVILTYGSDDLSGITNMAIRGAVMKAGERARAAGITMFATSPLKLTGLQSPSDKRAQPLWSKHTKGNRFFMQKIS
ncbi:hypothetical protein LOTGIDRAFT_176673 [Lottia gigantea]|uniref:VWFA domain-containing protein n=1 Tax=Lottia gigantea TaxID=225164 RepID=V4C1A8_LOTGI|nr:hypothetical protein LOTGIDRAFT_176673 [Lottia gigantea]ESO95259.1 hypothetical protein LOTGIDRAFT_176673 [Lottia gigantea]